MDPINDVKRYMNNYSNGISAYNSISSVNHATKDSTSNTNDYHSKPKSNENEGEIVDLKRNEISIRLKDNTIVKAKIFDSKSLNIGQIVSFKVKETSNGNVIEYIKSKSSDADLIIQKALDDANLPASKQNKTLVKKLLENNMSIDKKTLYKFLQETHANKATNIDSLIIMEKNNIPLTKTNVNQFEKYRNYEHRIVKELDSVSLSVSNLIKDYSHTANTDQLVKFNHDLINIIGDSNKSFHKSIPISSVFFTPTDADELVSVLSNYDIDSKLLDKITSQQASLIEVGDAILKSLEKADEIDEYRISSINEKNANAFSKITLAKDAFKTPLIKKILDKYAEIQRDNSSISSFLNNYNKAQLISKLRDFNGTVPITDKIWTGNMNSCELLREFDTMFTRFLNEANNNDYTSLKKSPINSDEKSLASSDVNNVLFTQHVNQKLNTLKKLFNNHHIKLSYKETISCFSRFVSSDELLVVEKALSSSKNMLNENELNIINDLFHSIAHYKKDFLMNLKNIFREYNQSISLKDTEILNELLSDELIKTSSDNPVFTSKKDIILNTITKILTSPQYTKLLKETLLNKWTISPNDLTNPDIIKETYKKIYNELNRINSFLEEKSLTAASEKLTNNIENTKSNIDFMSTLNSMFGYVQLPLKLRNQNVHSDLYVLTKKKKIENDPKHINVLLHLDMQYLGSIDINILLNNNQITAKFLVPDKTSKALFETNMENLEFALMEKGFLLKSNISLKKDEVDLVKDFIEKDTPNTSLKRYTFDVRT